MQRKRIKIQQIVHNFFSKTYTRPERNNEMDTEHHIFRYVENELWKLLRINTYFKEIVFSLSIWIKQIHISEEFTHNQVAKLRPIQKKIH